MAITLLMAAAVLVASSAVAALLIRQDVTTTASAIAPDVVFQPGTSYAAYNTAGYATLTVGTSGTNAALAVSGVPGAAQVAMMDVLKLTNQDVTNAYTVTLSRSATPAAALTDFTVTVKNAAGLTLATWNAATTATSSSFTLAVSSSADISIQTAIADGTAVGTVGSFGLQFNLVLV